MEIDLPQPISRVLVFGDVQGVRQLLHHLDVNQVCGIVAASRRPQYFRDLENLARTYSLPFLIQPGEADANHARFIEEVLDLQPDLLLVNSYSMLIPGEVLANSRRGGINLHGSLLPANRGPNPTQWAMLKGEQRTGVTLHEMTAGFDEGPIIDQRPVRIDFESTWLSIGKDISRQIDNLLEKNLSEILVGVWQSIPQNEEQASSNRRRTPADSEFRVGDSVIHIWRLIRAVLPPLPPAFVTTSSGRKLTFVEPPSLAELIATIWHERNLVGVGGGMAEQQLLVGKAVSLRPVTRLDAELLYEYIKDRETVVFSSGYWPISDLDHEEWLDSVLRKRTDMVIFVIETTDERGAIGTCKLTNISWLSRSADLQIRIGSHRHRDQGLGTEAVRLLCDFGFIDLGLNRIALHVWSQNTRAIRSYEKSGFESEGVLRQAALVDGHYQDVVVMARLSENHESAKQALDH